jgi:hypothetical protein
MFWPRNTRNDTEPNAINTGACTEQEGTSCLMKKGRAELFLIFLGEDGG